MVDPVAEIQGLVEVVPDPFEDDEPLVCGVENPEYCDTCQ